MTGRPITKVEFEWMANRLIYLATPYSLLPDLDAAATYAANIAARLSQATHGAVFSPIVHGHALCRAGNLDPIRDSIAWSALNDRMLEECDVLVVAHMDGWEESRGIQDEVTAFTATGRPIFDLVDLTHVRMERRQVQKPPRPRLEDRDDAAIDGEQREFLAAR